MANVIKLKRGTSTPTTSDIVDGEIAVDTSAKKLYVNDSGTVKEIGGGGGLPSDAQGNTVGGTNAGDSFSGTSALRNTLIGYNAGTAVETGDDNTFLGYDAGAANGAGGGNTFIGQKAGESNLGAQQSVAVGSYALASQNHSSHEGSSAVGYYSLYSQTSGKLNTALGRFAGYNCSEGEKNVFLGNLAGYGNITTGSNNIIIGHEATASSATVDNEITFGDTNITKFRIPGLNFSIKDSTATDNYVLTVDANGDAGWEAASGGGISHLVQDTSPQLGGSLDVNGQDIVTTSNADLELAPNGTGKTVLKGNSNPGTLVFNCENNSHGQTVKAQPHSASVTNALTLPAGGDQEIAGTVATQTFTNKTLTSPVLNTGVSGSAVLDEDNMASNSATQLATQQSIKAYVDANAGGGGGGGALEFVSKTTLSSSVSEVDFTSLADDSVYHIIGKIVNFSTATWSKLKLLDGSNTLITGAIEWYRMGSSASNASSSDDINCYHPSAAQLGFQMKVSTIANGGWLQYKAGPSKGNKGMVSVHASLNNTDRIGGVRFYGNSGTVDSGSQFLIYKYKES